MTSGRVDLLGGALATAGVAGLVFGLSHVPVGGWTSPEASAAAVAGALALASFAWRDRRMRDPLLPGRCSPTRGISWRAWSGWFTAQSCSACSSCSPRTFRRPTGCRRSRRARRCSSCVLPPSGGRASWHASSPASVRSRCWPRGRFCLRSGSGSSQRCPWTARSRGCWFPFCCFSASRYLRRSSRRPPPPWAERRSTVRARRRGC